MTVVSRERRGLIIDLKSSKNLVIVVSMLLVLEKVDSGVLSVVPAASSLIGWL